MLFSESLIAGHRIFSGEGSLRHLAAEVRRAKASRIAVFCGRSLAAHPTALHALRDALGELQVGVFDGVQAHSPANSIVAAADWLRSVGADGIVAFGGGSAIVSARAACIVHAEGASPRELATRRDAEGRLVSPRLLAPKMPVFAVPTTPTTATPKAGSAVHDERTGDRLAMFDPKTRVRCIVVEPSMLQTAPADLFVSASLNTLTMAISGLEGEHDNDFSEAFLRHALELAVDWLPRLMRPASSLEARMHLVHAAILCGQGTDLTGGGLVTAVSHSVGPESTAANGIVNAILLPHAMRFNAQSVPHRQARILAPLRTWASKAEAIAGTSAIGAVSAFLQSLQLPSTLREVGVGPQRFEAIATHAMNDWSLRSNPRQVAHADIVQLLRDAA